MREAPASEKKAMLTMGVRCASASASSSWIALLPASPLFHATTPSGRPSCDAHRPVWREGRGLVHSAYTESDAAAAAALHLQEDQGEDLGQLVLDAGQYTGLPAHAHGQVSLSEGLK